MSNKNIRKSDTGFLLQGTILAAASIISRIIGLVYRVPLTAIIGKTGNDFYGTAYEIYNIILLISSYSLPLAVSKLVAARWRKARQGCLPGTQGIPALRGCQRNRCHGHRLLRRGLLYRHVVKVASKQHRLKGLGAHTVDRGYRRRLPGLFPGPQHHDAQRHLPDRRADHERGGQCGGRLAIVLLRGEGGRCPRG